MFNKNHLDLRHAPFNNRYLQRIAGVVNNALAVHPRTMAFRVDLHLPEYRDTDDSIICDANISQGLLSRFIESLNVRVLTLLNHKKKEGKRTYPSQLRYIWIRELSANGKPHYHIVLFVNKDTFNTLGSYDATGSGVASLIQAAWLSALGLPVCAEYLPLVHFPSNPRYYLNSRTISFTKTYGELMFRLSYMAKERSKLYSPAQRSFGCSQG